MKKTIALVMALVMTAALLVGCGGQGSAGNSKFETADTYKLKIHLSVAATDPVYASAEKFVELVEAKTDGKVTFELYPSSSLGVTSDCLEGLSTGVSGRLIWDTWQDFAKVMSGPYYKLDKIIGGRYTLEQYEDALAAIRQGVPGKMLLYPDASNM